MGRMVAPSGPGATMLKTMAGERDRRKVALMTGASSGFGMLTSVELATAGFRVYGTMRNLAKREALDAKAAKANVAVEVVPLDVTDDASVADAVRHIVSEAGRIDVLVNNAGYGVGGFVEDMSMQEYRDQFETNFFGAVRMVKAVLPGMRERGSGRIILISSIGVVNPVPGLSAYNGSKAAVDAFGHALRYEVLGHGIFVSLIEPGTYNTDIFHGNAQYAAGALEPDSPNRVAFDNLQRFAMKQVERTKADPREVAVKVRKVATAERPRLRYMVGKDTLPIKTVRAVIPERAQEALIAKITKD